MAVKLVLSPAATVAVAGLIVITLMTGAVTVSVTLLEVSPLATAVIVVVPCVRVDAMPLPFKVATVVLLEVQVTEPDTLPVLPSV